MLQIAPRGRNRRARVYNGHMINHTNYCPHTAGLHALGDVADDPTCPDCGADVEVTRPRTLADLGRTYLDCPACGWADEL